MLKEVNNMFDKFLRQYIQDLMDCDMHKYDINEDDMNEIIDNLENNDHIWQVIDQAVYQQLDKYEIEEEN
jgi:hypothetical protein